MLNDIVCRALNKAGIPSVKEPPGLTRSDGKRPDGVTLTAWIGGKQLAWDVTVTDTLAQSYLHLTSQTAGAAAEAANLRKCSKYADISQHHFFQALAFETLGPINPSGLLFLQLLGSKLI